MRYIATESEPQFVINFRLAVENDLARRMAERERREQQAICPVWVRRIPLRTWTAIQFAWEAFLLTVCVYFLNVGTHSDPKQEKTEETQLNQYTCTFLLPGVMVKLIILMRHCMETIEPGMFKFVLYIILGF